MAALDAAVAHAPIEGEGDGGGGSVAVILHGKHHFSHTELEVFGSAFQNAVVGLMRYQPIDLLGGETGFGNHVFSHFGQRFHGEFEYAGAIHLQKRRAANDAVGNPAWGLQQVAVVAVGQKFAVQDAWLVGCAEHHGAGTVAEQHAGAAVGPVHDAAEHVGADD